MANILDIAKNIHPTHTLSTEELKERYLEIYSDVKRDIKFFIEVYESTSTPLFISGQIGSGKTTLLKSLLFDEPQIHYFDISDLSIANPHDAEDVVYQILYEILKLVYPSSDLSFFEELIDYSKNDYHDNYFDNDNIMDGIHSLKNKQANEPKAIVIDGLDRLLELSSYRTIITILLEYAHIWKALEQKIIFVTPLYFTQSNSLISEYVKIYESNTLDKTHLTIPLPDPSDTIFWKEFMHIRAKIESLKLSDKQIDDLVKISGGLLRSTLVVLRHLLNLMYRNGDIEVKEYHIEQLREDVKRSLDNLKSQLSADEQAILRDIDSKRPPTIPDNAISLFTKDIPLALFTKRDKKVFCMVHPLLDLNEIPF